MTGPAGTTIGTLEGLIAATRVDAGTGTTMAGVEATGQGVEMGATGATMTGAMDDATGTTTGTTGFATTGGM